jgi:succinoglycan biosynthesis protein ExoL
MRIAYLVHDINDPAVHRRIRMLHAGGAQVALLGFSRGPAVAPEAMEPVVLGQTTDARLFQRSIAVGRAALAMPRWQSALADADVIMARQLETLVLAAMARRITGSTAKLVYECLDIHRLMLSPGLIGRLMRALESGLLRDCDSIMVSSQRFIDAYFTPAHRSMPRVELVENKVLEMELDGSGGYGAQRAQLRPPAPPWRIGWYGVLRCRRSLHLLAGLVRSLPGLVEVTIRGKVARTVMPDFDEVVAATPGLSFDGPYNRSHDLPELYTTPHFFWAIDFYEAGGNSDWLLPNRLYEGGLFGAVPLALRRVETGSWLAAHGAGVLLDEELEVSLRQFFAGLDSDGFAAARQAMEMIPVSAFLHDRADCASLATRLLFGNAAPSPTSPTLDQGGAES